jgi:hypothetical protein
VYAAPLSQVQIASFGAHDSRLTFTSPMKRGNPAGSRPVMTVFASDVVGEATLASSPKDAQTLCAVL